MIVRLIPILMERLANLVMLIVILVQVQILMNAQDVKELYFYWGLSVFLRLLVEQVLILVIWKIMSAMFVCIVVLGILQIIYKKYIFYKLFS